MKHNWKGTSNGPHGEYMAVCEDCGLTDFASAEEKSADCPATTLVRVDAHPVTSEDALFLMLYHLRMAAMYFEATPDPIPTLPEDEFSGVPMRHWLEQMEALYDKED